MKVKEALIISSSNIRIHKLRSILTTVGIILGIAAVIAVVTLGASLEAYFIGEFKGTFDPTFFGVLPGEVTTGAAGGSLSVTPVPIFTDSDVGEISRIDYIKNIYPVGTVMTSPVDGVKFKDRVLLGPFGGVTVNTVPSGTTFGPEGIITLEHGTDFSNVLETVVGYGIAEIILNEENLAQISDVLGKSITVKFSDGNTTDFSIVGIIKTTEIAGGSVFDYSLFIDMSYYSEVRQVPGEEREEAVYYGLNIMVKEVGDVEKAQDAVLDYLRTNSDAKKFLDRDAPDLDFIILSEEEILKFVQAVMGQFGSFIMSVGLISLLVGTVGIANMMLVSVRERTREIGILKAFGARKRDILQVFLFEASLIAVIGSLIGVIVGIGLGYLFTQYGFFAGTHMPLTYKLEWIPISFTIGLLVGIISGLYPAWRASKVNPIEALRYE